MPYEFVFGSRDGQSTEGLIGDDEIEKTGGCWLRVQDKMDLSEVYVVDKENRRLDYDLTLGWDERLAVPFFKSKDPCPYCGGRKTKIMQRSGFISGYDAAFPRAIRGLRGLETMIVQCKDCRTSIRLIDHSAGIVEDKEDE
jgi:hypothetical protein